MKNNRLKVVSALCLVSSVFMLAGCGDLGNALANAGLNTLMGVATVFLMLVLISLLISCFSFINKFENWRANRKNKKNAAPAAEPAPAPAVQEPEVVEEETDDLELIAVITAAIAAQEGTSPDGLTVRSIRKVSSANKWKRG